MWHNIRVVHSVIRAFALSRNAPAGPGGASAAFCGARRARTTRAALAPCSLRLRQASTMPTVPPEAAPAVADSGAAGALSGGGTLSAGCGGLATGGGAASGASPAPAAEPAPVTAGPLSADAGRVFNRCAYLARSCVHTFPRVSASC